MKFGIRKLESWGYHAEEIMTLASFILTQCRLMTDRQTRYDRYYPH